MKTKPGKIRPAVVVQDDLLNEAGYPSTIVLPVTTKLADTDTPLRLRLSVANESFRKELGELPGDVADLLDQQLRAVLSL